MIPNIAKITTFREVFDWITYDLDDGYRLRRDNEGVFFVNKLCIGKKYLIYKTEVAELEEGLYEKVEVLYKLFKE